MQASKSDAGITVVAFVTFSAIFGLIGFYQGVEMGQAQSAHNYADSHKDYAANKIKSTCINMEPSLIAECVENAIDTSIENQRAEKDLAAQQNMAQYAKWLLALTTLATAITFFGVWYVRRTLIETKEAVRAADDAVIVTRDIGQAQARAYVDIDRAEVTGFAKNRRVRFYVTFKNTGTTPAKHFSIRPL